MKKLFVCILMMVFIVSGCATRMYDSNMELGKSQLKEENYLEAHEAFELAYEDDPTAEAKELMELSGLLSNGMKKYEDQDLVGAQVLFEEAAAYKVKFEEGRLMVEKAMEMLEQSEGTSVEPVEEDTEPEESTDDETAEEIPESEAEDNPALETETPKEVQEQEDETAVKEEPVEDEPVDGEKKESDSSFTKADAEQLVKDYVDFETNPQLQIHYDHDDEKGDYIFQVFEVVNDSNEGGHTATWGWYGVNKEEKEVYEVM